MLDKSAVRFEAVLGLDPRTVAAGWRLIAGEHVGVEVHASGPCQCFTEGVDADLTEHGVVVDRGEHAIQSAGKVQLPNQVIRERDLEYAATEVLDINHSGHTHMLILVERFDGLEGVGDLRTSPVRLEFLPVDLRPMLNELVRSAWKCSSDETAIWGADQGLVLAVDCVKVERVVIDEVPVDHDSVERAEARHMVQSSRVL